MLLTSTVIRGKRVHPVLSWVKLESAAVKEDRRLEVLSIAKSADTTLDGHDLAVHSFRLFTVVCALYGDGP